MVVHRHHEDEGVCAHARLGELRVFGGRAFVARGQAQLAYVYQLALDALALAQLAEDEARDVLAHAPLPRRAEDDGDEKRAFVCHAAPPLMKNHGKGENYSRLTPDRFAVRPAPTRGARRLPRR